MSMMLTLTLLAALTPAQGQIENARARIGAGVAPAAGYTSLAVGLTRRARETGDAAYYDQAILALDEAERNAADRRLGPDGSPRVRHSASLHRALPALPRR